METGAVVGNIDVAQLVLYTFWIFFAGLIFYIRREDRREGYPLESEIRGQPKDKGFLLIPKPKTFNLFHGGKVKSPNFENDKREIKLAKAEPWPGAPYVPTGNPMVDGVGAAAYAERSDTPDLTTEGHPKIVPLRVATDFAVLGNWVDPTGYSVVAADDVEVGKIVDLWVDRSESLVRYFEVELEGGQMVLLPMMLANIDTFGMMKRVHVKSLLSSHFASVPKTKTPDQVTLLEEDMIQAYYTGGHLYATPERSEPLL